MVIINLQRLNEQRIVADGADGNTILDVGLETNQPVVLNWMSDERLVIDRKSV